MLEQDGELFAKEVLREQFYPRTQSRTTADLNLKRFNLALVV